MAKKSLRKSEPPHAELLGLIDALRARGAFYIEAGGLVARFPRPRQKGKGELQEAIGFELPTQTWSDEDETPDEAKRRR